MSQQPPPSSTICRRLHIRLSNALPIRQILCHADLRHRVHSSIIVHPVHSRRRIVLKYPSVRQQRNRPVKIRLQSRPLAPWLVHIEWKLRNEPSSGEMRLIPRRRGYRRDRILVTFRTRRRRRRRRRLATATPILLIRLI